MSSTAPKRTLTTVEQSSIAQGRRWSRPWLIVLGILVVLTVSGLVIYRELNQEIGRGPNPFVLSSGSTQPGHIAYHYYTFNGMAREKSQVSAGQIIQFTYAADVTKGSLSMEVKDPTGVSLWRVNVPEHQARTGTGQFPAHRTGQYLFVVTGLDTGGSFDLSWHVK